jgi:hypothetical protein
MQLAVPRYTQKGFPRYRHVPTKTPHPVIHPEGHSYKKTEEKTPRWAPEQWVHNETYLYGIDLFNHGYWWEAHEAWENVWMGTKKNDLEGRYLQALIQFSAALLKLLSGNKKGFDNLHKESAVKFHHCLKEMSDHKMHQFMGLDLEKWMKRVVTFCDSLESIEGEPQDPLHFASFPALILER